MTAWHPTTPLAHVVYAAGFEYEASQDILKSRADAPLQSRTGFNWGYDLAAAELLMIIDCERFYFTCRGKKWLIELWKGQYGLETGAEIGVYNAVDHTAQLAAADQRTAGPGAVRRLSSAREAVHHAIHDARRLYQDPSAGQYARPPRPEWLRMSSTLRRHGTVLVRRGPEPHWWLTGWKWGVFTRNTRDLALDVAITLLDLDMYERFRAAVVATGYHVTDKGNLTIGFTFHHPKTPQPRTRMSLEADVQATNERLVAGYTTLRDELKLSSNNPNGFDTPTLAKFLAPKVKQGIVGAAKTLKHDVADAAKHLHPAEAAKHVKHEMSEASRTAYENVLRFFQKGWRSSLSATG